MDDVARARSRAPFTYDPTPNRAAACVHCEQESKPPKVMWYPRARGGGHQPKNQSCFLPILSIKSWVLDQLEESIVCWARSLWTFCGVRTKKSISTNSVSQKKKNCLHGWNRFCFVFIWEKILVLLLEPLDPGTEWFRPWIHNVSCVVFCKNLSSTIIKNVLSAAHAQQSVVRSSTNESIPNG